MHEYTLNQEKALAIALGNIPIVHRVKDMVPRSSGIGVVESEVVKPAALSRLLSAMNQVNPDPDGNRTSLTSILYLLRQLGIVDVEESNGETLVSATSEPASYLLKNLSILISTASDKPSPLKRNTRIDPFREVFEAALSSGFINPHLLLSNIIANDIRYIVGEPPRKRRIISVLIKGTRRIRGQTNSERTIPVFLHVFKPGYEKFALLGSGHEVERTEELTARLALDEDLQTSAEAFKLIPADVPDSERIDLSVKRGVVTLYSFNLFIATELIGKLEFDEDENKAYKWFTLREILNGKSVDGDPIMTDRTLITRVHEKLDMTSDAVPSIATNVVNYEPTTFAHQFRETWSRYSIALRATAILMHKVLEFLWKLRWWIGTVIVLLGAFLLLRPLLREGIPELANIDALIGICMFIVFLIGLIRERSKSNK